MADWRHPLIKPQQINMQLCDEKRPREGLGGRQNARQYKWTQSTLEKRSSASSHAQSRSNQEWAEHAHLGQQIDLNFITSADMQSNQGELARVRRTRNKKV